MQIRKITECSCFACKTMCVNSPCMGTPEDISKIIDAGHGDRLMLTVWTDEKTGNQLPAIAPVKGPKGCVFQNQDGLCDLHASGLKPTEGKLAIHDMLDGGLRRTVGYTWISEEGIAVFEKLGVQDVDELKKVIREMIPFLKPGRIVSL
jgi:hypothetical protein